MSQTLSMFPFTITVPAHTAMVEYRHGALERVLTPGRHPRGWGQRTRRWVDLREALLSISPQEVLTADGVSVRVSAVVRWVVTDPVAFLERTTDPLAAVYLATQVALRDALAGLGVDALGRRGVGPATGSDASDASSASGLGQLTAAVASVAAEVGVEVREVVLKDVILPAEVRSAALELVTAQARGAAQLEAARAETAALRSLANAAKLLDAHPALAQLRLVQAAPFGTQLVVRVGGTDRSSERAD